MSVVTRDMQSLIKDLLASPSEEKAFYLLQFIHANRNVIERGGLENKVKVVVPQASTAKAIHQVCMVIRDTMVSNHEYEQSCDTLELIERTLHHEMKDRRSKEEELQPPFL